MERGVAKVNKILKKARSLCAVFLAGMLMFLAIPAYAADDDIATAPLIDPNMGTEYVYNITIEFGSFDFYYDYGVWDSADLRYEANASSEYPANGTDAGYPGWYGFDGVTNKIRVENNSTASDSTVKVNVSFTDEDSEMSFPLQKDSIKMTCYNEVGLTTVVNGADAEENTYDFTIDAKDVEKTVYVSFSGEPKNTDGTDFTSSEAKIVGYITLTVSLPNTEETQ